MPVAAAIDGPGTDQPSGRLRLAPENTLVTIRHSTPPPVVLLPHERITPENASRLVSLAVLEAGGGQVLSVAWSPDGKLLAVTNDLGSVQLWDAVTDTLRLLLQPTDATGWANMVTWSPDSRMLASTRQGGQVQVWDATSGRELITLVGHQREVWGAAWSPDNWRLASASNESTIRLWGVR